MRNKSLPALAAGILLVAGGARADVSWEHTATLRWSLAPKQVLKAKIYNILDAATSSRSALSIPCPTKPTERATTSPAARRSFADSTTTASSLIHRRRRCFCPNRAAS